MRNSRRTRCRCPQARRSMLAADRTHSTPAAECLSAIKMQLDGHGLSIHSATRPMMDWKDQANLDAASSRMLASRESNKRANVTPAALGAAAGAAAVTAGRSAFTALGNGLSFAAELTKVAGRGSAAPDVAT